MNILFFLMPKGEVSFLFDDMTMRQVIEKFDYYKYSSMPILNHKGEYVGTITEGDILRKLRTMEIDIKAAENIPISEIPRRTDNQAVKITQDMEDTSEVNNVYLPASFSHAIPTPGLFA